MRVEMYSRSEFPQEARTGFKLPADPYKSEEAAKYLKDLGVFFYRDQEHGQGLILSSDEDEAGNFLSYFFDVELGGDGSPMPWDSPTPQIISKNGDDKAWLRFNKQCVIHSFDNFSVRVS